MSELIMPVESVVKILNLLPKVEGYLDFDERGAVLAFVHGHPTDKQQLQVLYICRAVMDTRDQWEMKHGERISL